MASSHTIETDTAIAITGPAAAVGDDESLVGIGQRYLGCQIANIGGGTTEMASNVIAERVLNFPREYALIVGCRSARCAVARPYP